MQKIKLLTPTKEHKGTSDFCCTNQSVTMTESACCTSSVKENPQWVTGTIATSVDTIMKISTDLTRCDYWGMIKSRVSGFRMHYTVPPGLYAVGEPKKDSDIFVTANYKISFDVLRRELKDLNAWMLVLDTKGINVWCAAGKGTFGTDELVKRITETKLVTFVNHRRIILPQLAAVGVSAGEVKKKTGFLVYFGTLRAADIFDYICATKKPGK